MYLDYCTDEIVAAVLAWLARFVPGVEFMLMSVPVRLMINVIKNVLISLQPPTYVFTRSFRQIEGSEAVRSF